MIEKNFLRRGHSGQNCWTLPTEGDTLLTLAVEYQIQKLNFQITLKWGSRK